MATSLYDLSVPTFLQTVTAVAGFLDRAAAHCAQTGADPDDLVEARLFADMAPFHFQIEAAWHHALWGVEALRTGAFTPPALVGPVPFAALRAIIAEGQAALRGVPAGSNRPGRLGRRFESWETLTCYSLQQRIPGLTSADALARAGATGGNEPRCPATCRADELPGLQ